MSPEPALKEIQAAIHGVFVEAMAEAPRILAVLKDVQSIAPKVDEALAGAAGSAPGPHIDKLSRKLRAQNDAIVGRLDQGRLNVISLVKGAVASSGPQRRVIELLKEVVDTQPTLTSELKEQLADTVGGATSLKTATEFSATVGVLAAEVLFSAYLDSARALLGEHSDLYLKATSAGSALFRNVGEAALDAATLGLSTMAKGLREVVEGLRTSAMKELIEAVENSTGAEKLLALEAAFEELDKQADLSLQVLALSETSIKEQIEQLDADVAILDTLIHTS
ncbi:MAG TPA: hypothetical protein VGM43_01045 [Bryobacteraceae bacterium]|jgi:hypothetical protein